jgi:class III poly(R)-hydroxyalkanoic acid synthase PhaE subunit
MRQWTQWAAPFMPPLAPGGVSTAGSTAGGAGAANPMGAGGAAAGLTQQVLSQVEQSLGVSRAMWDLLGRSAALADTGQRLASFNDGVQQLQAQLGRFFAPLAAPTASGVANAASGAGAMMPGMPQFGPQMFNPLAFGLPFAGLPGVGPAREQQEAMERLASLAQRVMQAQAQLATQWGQLLQNALRDMGGALTPKLQSGALPGSLREVYDQWVATAEKIYAGAAGGSVFAQAQSELANALSQLRIAQRDWLEEWGRAFDLPTRAELNSLHQQVRALKEAVQKLGDKV